MAFNWMNWWINWVSKSAEFPLLTCAGFLHNTIMSKTSKNYYYSSFCFYEKFLIVLGYFQTSTTIREKDSAILTRIKNSVHQHIGALRVQMVASHVQPFFQTMHRGPCLPKLTEPYIVQVDNGSKGRFESWKAQWLWITAAKQHFRYF